ncbi:putative candidate secreted effector protein [Blumeria hordei DH14]|uniref:Putative candidate secreted effector protein n=1 Tax=Blumeria graminis f. sp. hordei (strain DH14) TaxID=546991 RepID=N1JQF1_BLUG1|nr:putative candidate secreted effector protein [Blumeria hordei DH14]
MKNLSFVSVMVLLGIFTPALATLNYNCGDELVHGSRIESELNIGFNQARAQGMHSGIYNASESYGSRTFEVSSVSRSSVIFSVTVHFNSDKIITKVMAEINGEQVRCDPKGVHEGGYQ